MNPALPVIGFQIAVSLALGTTLSLIISGAIYDARQTRRQSPYLKHPNARQFKRRPKVTVLMYTSNHSRSIVDCLENLYKNTYKKIDVVVVDNASKDDTVQNVRDWIKAHPKHSVQLIARRKPSVKLTGAEYKRISGEYILILDPNMTISADAVQKAVMYFLTDDTLLALTPRQTVSKRYTLTNQALQLSSIIRARFDKTRAVFKKQLPSRGFTMMSRSGFTSKTTLSPVYAADVVVITNGSPVPKTASQWVSGLFDPVLGAAYIAYLMHLALIQKIVEPFGIVWLGLSVICLCLIWSDDRTSYLGKLRFTLHAPLWFVFLCVSLVVRVIGGLLAIPVVIGQLLAAVATKSQKALKAN